MTQGPGWLDQWQRCGRWHALVAQSETDFRADRGGTEGYRDEVFALFQALWHMKDWIKNDPAADPRAREEVEGWIEVNGHNLKIAADLANGSKHLILTNTRAGGASQVSNDATVMVGSGVRHVFRVHDPRDDSERTVVDVAIGCINEWRVFFSMHGLDISGL